jgi:CheY-like chemotaxis protein
MRVLVVEDEAVIALMMESILVDAGHQIFGVASSVPAAQQLLESGTPDSAVVDMRLGSGFSLPIVRTLAARGVPFVIMTGYPASEFDGGAFKPVVVLQKPIDMTDLLQALAALDAVRPGKGS